jgi:hypothetical protein
VEVGDWTKVDSELVGALAAWRARAGLLAALPGEVDFDHDFAAREVTASPLPERIVHEELRYELAERKGDPVASALSAWLEVLAIEHDGYRERFETARSWALLREIRGRDRPTAARELRTTLLAHPHAAPRERAAIDLSRVASDISEHALRALERRIERDERVAPSCRHLAVAELEPSAIEPFAGRVLSESDDLASSVRADAWYQTLEVALARRAKQGWPVKPRQRWLLEVFAGTDIAGGMRVPRAKLPEGWGASSYARALGSLGMRLFEAGRPTALPFAMHQHPYGVRKQLRRALFASIAAETSFATRVLGLGKGPALDHRRELLRAMALSLRIDAWRVITAATARQGLGAAREAYRATGERVLGSGLGAEFCGVLPTLRSGDGAALCAAVLAWARRRELIDRFDEDWFRNPRAIAELRHEDSLARDPTPIAVAGLDAALDLLVSEAEQVLG